MSILYEKTELTSFGASESSKLDVPKYPMHDPPMPRFINYIEFLAAMTFAYE